MLRESAYRSGIAGTEGFPTRKKKMLLMKHQLKMMMIKLEARLLGRNQLGGSKGKHADSTLTARARLRAQMCGRPAKCYR